MPPTTTTNLTLCEPTRGIIEQAYRNLESSTTDQDNREWAIHNLEEIYNSAPETRTPYHFACVCYLLAVHSPAGVYDRKVYARKCLNEAKKKLKKVRFDSYDMGPLRDEFSFTEQLFKGLEKKTVVVMDKITLEIRRLRLENNMVNGSPSPSPKKVQARYVMKKKKKVSLARVVEQFEDEEDEAGEWDDDYEDMDGDDERE